MYNCCNDASIHFLKPTANNRKVSSQSTDSDEFYCEIKKDSLTNQYRIGTPTKLEDFKGDESLLRSPSAWSPGLTGKTETFNQAGPLLLHINLFPPFPLKSHCHSPNTSHLIFQIVVF